jgi:hypothetical protein
MAKEAGVSPERSRHCDVALSGWGVRNFAITTPTAEWDARSQGRGHLMAISVPTTTRTPIVLPLSKTVVLLATTVLLALLVYYFIGVDEGATSIFGNTMVVHEFVHDARHFLGFPCH